MDAYLDENNQLVVVFQRSSSTHHDIFFNLAERYNGSIVAINNIHYLASITQYSHRYSLYEVYLNQL